MNAYPSVTKGASPSAKHPSKVLHQGLKGASPSESFKGASPSEAGA